MYPPRPDGTLRWAPVKGGIEFHQVPDAPAPAATQAERLRQMRDMLKRFSAHRILQEEFARLHASPDLSSDRPLRGCGFGSLGWSDLRLCQWNQPQGTPRDRSAAGTRRRFGNLVLRRGAACSRKVSLKLGRQDVWAHLVKEVQAPEDTYFLARRPRNPSVRD